MGFRNISAWAIRNPVPPIVLFLALTLAGIVSFMRMDVNNQPDIDFPVAFVAISHDRTFLDTVCKGDPDRATAQQRRWVSAALTASDARVAAAVQRLG